MNNKFERKIKGKYHKAKGELQQTTGQGMKGGVSKAKGLIYEASSDLEDKLD